MSYLPQFKYDLFISYAHDDNRGAGPGWVDRFHRELEDWLSYRRGFRDLSVWRDERLHGNTLFDDSIRDTLEQSALFIALNSRNFLQSEYCARELEHFLEFHEGRSGLVAGAQHRVLNVLLGNIPHQQWPKGLPRTAGFAMHDANGDETGDFTSPDADAGAFEKQLRRIVDAIEVTLQALQNHSTQVEPVEAEESPVRVFIADVSDNLGPVRDQLVRELGPAHVLDDVPPPMEEHEHDEKARTELRKAALSVHLLDGVPGRRIAGRPSGTYPTRQLELAMEGDRERIVWVNSRLAIDSIEDIDYRTTLESLEGGARDKNSYHFLRSESLDLRHYVQERIQALGERREKFGPTDRILIDTHQKDQRYAFKLADALAEREISVEFNQESQDATRSLEAFEQAIPHVSHLVIMFGQVNPTWLQARVQKAIRVVASSLGEHGVPMLERIWVYLLPGSEGATPSLRIPALFQVDVLDNSGTATLDTTALDKLVEGVRSVGRHG